jgi:hypothetical protein
MSEQSTKKRYQFFRKIDRIYFDDIHENIELISTPCSDIFMLTDEEYSLLYRAVVHGYNYEGMRLRCLDNWVETSDIMKDISAELEWRRAEEARELARKAKADAKKQKFADQCSGKNGKVKSSK